MMTRAGILSHTMLKRNYVYNEIDIYLFLCINILYSIRISISSNRTINWLLKEEEI
jgi:hypothetical protein